MRGRDRETEGQGQKQKDRQASRQRRTGQTRGKLIVTPREVDLGRDTSGLRSSVGNGIGISSGDDPELPMVCQGCLKRESGERQDQVKG